MKVWLLRIGGIYGLEIGLQWRCWSITAVVSFPRLYLEREKDGNIVWCNFKQIDTCEAGAVLQDSAHSSYTSTR